MMDNQLETTRLILRHWQAEDYPAYAKINANPFVMEYFPAALSEEESYQQVDHMKVFLEEHNWGLWAVELKDTGEFIGFVGLNRKDATSGIPNSPLIEIGWRLSPEHWGKGYATEAAHKALEFAFNELEVKQVYAFTTVTNARSRQVMDSIGMQDMQQDFSHPKLDPEHPLAQHCLYKLTKEQWLSD
ncbi:GNAT family N-acetyltransferase [Marinomonas transparens]|uniref:GNAT family N-acetyltransferase n=1 Tax=Marinomonas transparens TaxID=2795388 RepID=A0A934MZA7_9GAMM|nr:GNAT family N-acetyltransferase [Marinomonas transparens]MBJ7537340.1 GNAT family N-acetyltransferase [Marinomonas transparens]